MGLVEPVNAGRLRRATGDINQSDIQNYLCRFHAFARIRPPGSPVGDFEFLFCHVIPPEGHECDDLILITAKSSIYSIKPMTC